MVKLELSDKEARALKELLTYSNSACSSGCAFSEMQKSRKGCDKCDYPKAIANVAEKLGMYD